MSKMIDPDFDNDTEDFDKGPSAGERVSLKDAWDSNPLLKIAAVVLAVGLAAGAYMTLKGEDVNEDNKTRVTISGQKMVETVAGATEVDEEYKQAVEEKNQQAAEQALQTGTSAMPTPISTAKEGGIDFSERQTKTVEDPLKEWRAQAEAVRAEEQKDLIPEEEAEMGAQAPDVVPMVTPVRPQAAMKMDPEAAKALSAQMRTILAAQAPTKARKLDVTKQDSLYVQDKKEAATQKAAANSPAGKAAAAAAAGGGDKKAEKKLIISAGSISYAQLLNELNSDIEGPALAQILSGPLAGGRAIGEFKMKDEYLVIEFARIVKDGVSYRVNGIALNEDTTLAAHQSDVDHHYLTRVVLPAAAKFVEGYGKAVAETGTTSTTTSGGGVVQDTREPNEKEQLYKGFKEASGKVGEILDEGAERPITVKVHRGVTMGILFIDPVTTASADK